MAVTKKTTITRTDDLGGQGAASEVKFAIDGVPFTIDLNKRNRETFMRRMLPYINAGRKDDQSDTLNTFEIRAWARENGFEVNERGRIPLAVVEAYQASVEGDLS